MNTTDYETFLSTTTSVIGQMEQATLPSEEIKHSIYDVTARHALFW